MRWTRHLSKLGNLNCLELLRGQFTEIKSRFSFWFLLSFHKQTCFQITGWRRSTNCECCRSWWAYCQTKHFWLPKWNLPGCLETIHRWRTFHQRYSQRHPYSTIPVQGKLIISHSWIGNVVKEKFRSKTLNLYFQTPLKLEKIIAQCAHRYYIMLICW